MDDPLEEAQGELRAASTDYHAFWNAVYEPAAVAGRPLTLEEEPQLGVLAEQVRGAQSRVKYLEAGQNPPPAVPE